MSRKRGATTADRPGNWGIAQQALQKDVDALAVRDVLHMFFNTPAVMNARISVFGDCLSEVFSFAIPALGITSEGYGENLLQLYWMPCLQTVYDWLYTHGIIPYYFVKRGKHPTPVCPPFGAGKIVTRMTEKHEQEFDFFWTHPNLKMSTVEPDRNMLWIRTPYIPSINGELRSPLAAHLENYRSLLIMRTGMNIVNTQGPRPTHLIEQHLSGATAVDDDLRMYQADYGKAAGIHQKRRDEAAEIQLRMKTRQLYKSMEQDQMRNNAKSKVAPTLWTDTPQELLEESDAGFANRVIVMRPNLVYKQATEPKMPYDYAKSEARFELMISATMNRSLESLTPTGGGSRSQNVEGASRFENSRNKALANFFASVIRTMLIGAYGGEMRYIMEGAKQHKLKKFGGDPSSLVALYPELDVQVTMKSASVVDNAELRLMRNDGILTQQSVAKRIGANNNIPDEELVTLDWPSGIPRDVEVPGGPKPPKPEPKVASATKKAKK